MQPDDRITPIIKNNYKTFLEFFERHTHCASDAADLTQALFESFVQTCLWVAVPDNPVAFLWTCAQHRLSDYYKAGARLQSLPDAVEEIEAGGPSPVALAESNEQLAILLRAIDEGLKDQPYNQRASFRMRYLFGYRHRDISAKLGIPINQVGPCLARARRAVIAHLRQHLQKAASH